MNHEHLKKCTVRISLKNKNNHEGTGFFVSPNLILTCYHVIKATLNTPIDIYWNNKTYTATIKKIPENPDKIDLALLEINDFLDESLQVDLDESVNVGDELYTFGYPDQYPNGDPGTFQCEGITGDTPPLIKFKSGQVRPGFSGSPLLNLRTNKVCGIIIKTRDRNTDLGGRAIPTSVIFAVFPELKPQLAANPFIPQTGMIDDPQLIFGRDREIKEAFEILNSGSSVAIIGEKAIGKSSLIKAIEVQSSISLNLVRQPIYINLAAEVYHEEDFYAALCDKVGIPISKGYQLSRELNKQSILLILDEVENMAWDGFTNSLRSQLRGLASKSSHDAPLRLVVASNKPLNQMFPDSNMVSPFENICIEIFLKPWNESIMREFISSRLSKTSCQFTEEEILNLIK